MLFDQLLVAQQKIDDLTKEQESLIDIFAEERDRRENEELKLKKRLQVQFPTKNNKFGIAYLYFCFAIVPFIACEDYSCVEQRCLCRMQTLPSKCCVTR